jgi:hypothetical protein
MGGDSSQRKDYLHKSTAIGDITQAQLSVQSFDGGTGEDQPDAFRADGKRLQARLIQGIRGKSLAKYGFRCGLPSLSTRPT